MVPDTVQLIVLVAGLCSSAPALLVMRPAGIAPRRSAQTKRSYQYCCFSAVGSASASAGRRAGRCRRCRHRAPRPAWSSGGTSCPRCPATPAASGSPALGPWPPLPTSPCSCLTTLLSCCGDRSGGRDPVIRVVAAPKSAGDDACRALRAACVSLFSWRCRRTPARHAPLPDDVTANPCTPRPGTRLGPVRRTRPQDVVARQQSKLPSGPGQVNAKIRRKPLAKRG